MNVKEEFDQELWEYAKKLAGVINKYIDFGYLVFDNTFGRKVGELFIEDDYKNNAKIYYTFEKHGVCDVYDVYEKPLTKDELDRLFVDNFKVYQEVKVF